MYKMWIYLKTILVIVAYFPLQITMSYIHLSFHSPNFFIQFSLEI